MSKNDYPGKGVPWADFLHHRARVLAEWRKEGKTCAESARLMSMDATQVSLILMSLPATKEVTRG